MNTNNEKMNTNESDAAAESNDHTSSDIKFLNFDNFSQFYETFSTNIKDTVASSTKIPLKQTDLDYYSTSPAFKHFIQTQNERILKMIASLLKQQNIKKNNIYSSKLDDEERMDLLIDSNDQIIEKLGIQLDEIQGLRKKTETELKFTATSLNLTSRNINTSWNKDMGMVVNKTLLEKVSVKNSSGQTGVFIDKNKGVIEKPQILFSDKPDNSQLPFVPKIRQKPNCLQPLPEIFNKLDKIEIDKDLFENNTELLENPYLYEIDQLELTESVTSVKQPIQSPIELDATPFKYIDKVDDLIWLCDHLSKKNRSNIKEISVDLEHHSYRSFLGFTCLMQISTRTQDFLVDTIKLRSEMHRLNEIFTDWTLVKIMHGSDFDIEWLQKDFGIYVVNLFDTGQATRILQYPHFSLSYLLQKFCNVTAQKQYQLADWRQRPLNDPMIRYAREDTHYLIYIYDHLRQELLSKNNSDNDLNHFKQVHEKSKTICKKVYKKPVFLTKGFLTLCQHNSHLNSKQMKALRDLYVWRDKIARESDESCEYVLKNHQLLKIAELLPREIYGILALCNPLSNLVQTNVHEMNEIIKNAREFKGTFTTTDIENEKNNISTIVNNSVSFQSKPNESVLESIVHLTVYDPNNIINNPHDLTHTHSNQNGGLDESMNIDNEQEMKLNLKDLLIKTPTDVILPDNLVKLKESKLSNMFSKNDQFNLKEKNLKEKIKKINDTIENPFGMFFPADLRLNNQIQSEYTPWNLIKATAINQSLDFSNNVALKQEEPVILNEDTLMIPLKKQFNLEKYSSEKQQKAKNKTFKNLEYNEAIIAYNKSQEEKQMGLGNNNNNNNSESSDDSEVDLQQQKLTNLIEEKIRSNLKLLSSSVPEQSEGAAAGGGGGGGATSSTKAFEYDINKINSLFSSQDKNTVFDPTSKMRKGNFNKVNKRRTTNAVTRSNNAKSVTFKMSNNNAQNSSNK